MVSELLLFRSGDRLGNPDRAKVSKGNSKLEFVVILGFISYVFLERPNSRTTFLHTILRKKDILISVNRFLLNNQGEFLTKDEVP